MAFENVGTEFASGSGEQGMCICFTGIKWPSLCTIHCQLSNPLQQELGTVVAVDELRDWFISTAGAWSVDKKSLWFILGERLSLPYLVSCKTRYYNVEMLCPDPANSMAKWYSVSWSVLLIYQGKVYGNLLALLLVLFLAQDFSEEVMSVIFFWPALVLLWRVFIW